MNTLRLSRLTVLCTSTRSVPQLHLGTNTGLSKPMLLVGIPTLTLTLALLEQCGQGGVTVEHPALWANLGPRLWPGGERVPAQK
jgi:hypothetical protein